MAKGLTDIRSLARQYTEQAVETLAHIMRQPKSPESSRVAAATALLDRGWGKPHQTSEMTVRRVIARELGDDELAAIAAGDSEPSHDGPVH
jgi:hypothetical protein